MEYTEITAICQRMFNMTPPNAERFILSKVRKALKGHNIALAASLIRCDASFHFCDYCPEDDFGYCGLRRDGVPLDEINLKYCLPAWLEMKGAGRCVATD